MRPWVGFKKSQQKLPGKKFLSSYFLWGFLQYFLTSMYDILKATFKVFISIFLRVSKQRVFKQIVIYIIAFLSWITKLSQPQFSWQQGVDYCNLILCVACLSFFINMIPLHICHFIFYYLSFLNRIHLFIFFDLEVLLLNIVRTRLTTATVS